MIEEPVNAAPHFISSGPGRMSGLNHSGPSLVAAAPETAPLEEAGAESQSQPSDDPDRLAIVLVKGPPLKKPRLTRDLQSGLFEQLQERQQEIEVSCASAHDAHPDGGEVEMATETSAAPAIIPAEDASDICVRTKMWGFRFLDKSYPLLPHLRRNLLTMPLLLALSATRSWKLRPPRMAQQHDLFTQLLQTADYMKTFSSRRQEIENQLRLRMEEAEASLSTMREENEALRVELAEAKEELAADYQQQVDDTFIFGYRCCMKKNDIKRDTPSIPPGEEKKLHEKPAP
ncbi:hypothetical protein CK203_111028 [Vitis vinifera]|uniref:Uncharacterized protein n=1 Tax=Vitis vinifera TaxID=29760 RepID=A0A438CQZ6_VITVI|nr:hypothetical protein CK203_111028 [Vitis vinifera]